MKQFVKLLFTAFFLLIFFNSQAQISYREWFNYFSPQPAAKFIMPEQKISFRLQNKVAPAKLLNVKINLKGSVSGQIDGILSLASDRQTVIFSPLKAYSLNECVEVVVQFPEALNIPDFSTSFTTTSLPAKQRKMVLHEILQQETRFNPALPVMSFQNKNSLKVVNDSLPSGFPEITITHWNDPSDGYIFVSPLNYDSNKYFQIILDNYATPVYYRDLLPHGAMDFKLQPNGYLTTYLTSVRKFIVQNTSFETIDTIAGQNGYDVDIHELRYY